MKRKVYNVHRFILVVMLLAGLFEGTKARPGQERGISETYLSSDRVRSGIAIGGLGTGSVELRKNGQFYNWTILNNWPLGTGAPLTVKSYPGNHADQSFFFFLVRYQVEGESPRIKLLQLNNSLSEGGMQSIDYYYPWMSAVDRIDYSACFPVTTMTFTDREMPLRIHLEAFSPFIPHDARNSSIPGAYFNFRVEATGEKPVKVFLVATLRNLAGYDVIDKHFISRAYEGEGYRGFAMTCGGMDPEHPSAGEMGIFSLSDASSYYLGWEHKHPYYEKLLVSDRFENINDTDGRNREVDGRLVGRVQHGNNDQRCFSSIGVDRVLDPGERFENSFVLAWYFPNLYGGVSSSPDPGEADYALDIVPTRILGHYYNNHFSSCGEVGLYLAENRETLTRRTIGFQENFYHSSLPPYVLNQVNSQLNTFITSSVFTEKGTFAIREGMTPEKPWGPFGTIDVSLYGSSSIIALFPELQKSMMHAHRRIQSDDGEIHHGLQADVDLEHNGTWGVFHRIDLVPNYIQMVLRDFFWTGDREYLEAMWPSVTRGIDYILTRRDKDDDMMPDMEGIMSSYDNFPMYGLASYIQSQWLAAMTSVKKAALVTGDRKTGKLAGEILEKGTRLMEEKLWNGSYYMLSNDYTGDRGKDDGVLTDQLVGQWVAHQSGLGHMLAPERVRSALASVMGTSYIDGFGLRNCTWPSTPDLFPIEESNLWVDQANTCWSGVELAFASFLLYEGMVEEAEKVISTVDDRYRRAGLYWDHQEFGGHYYRPMSAWSILHGYLGLGIADGHYTFDPRSGDGDYTMFFSHGNGTAHYSRSDEGIGIHVRTGEMGISSLEIADPGFSGEKPSILVDGKKVKVWASPPWRSPIRDFPAKNPRSLWMERKSR
jgi:uncharacterized protein (DUF608 family)